MLALPDRNATRARKPDGFTIAFNWSARRSDPRFVLPQAVALALYGGAGVEALAFAARRPLRVAGRGALVVVFGLALLACASVDRSLLRDPRYEAEAWLAAHVAPGDTIETYGLNVYLPRFPSGVRVIRVGPEPLDRRNPVPGIEEVVAPYSDAPRRGARFVVVSTGWVWRFFLESDGSSADGKQRAPTRARSGGDADTNQFFEALVGGRIPAYGYAKVAEYEDGVFPRIDVHGTTARTIWIYERR